MTSVLLLRAASKDVPDKYESSFVAAGYAPTSIPVLETSLTNTGILVRILSNTSTGFSGVILTSARACQAWKSASDLVATPSLVRWCALPFYVVGKSTASALREIDGAPKDIRGEDSGNAEQLARYILNDARRMSGKLLYLTGDKNRDTLPSILASNNLILHQLQVYETRGSARFASDLADVLSKGTDDTGLWWIVYFAPSAAESVTPALNLHFDIAGGKEDPSQKRRQACVAAIGPTTHDFLRDTLKLHVHAVASKPTPDDLVSAIKAHDGINSVAA
ncbi:tetrapyrrole biosynthesis, uroporphyrinogen III synthase [Pleurotus eryngii]|uniref:Tetrapyrrole biosynthesis, uroporphyrinogen III synthase n=1 Tax=Pleurotus eryngii TaxID=5323 RepID=A0A9P6DKL5_PLEER|nr:tetrapyrrole biosynthesis, uroporphyrinogen III synthase [Pleurotus eryngii]